MKTLKKINKIVRIVSFVTTLLASLSSFALGNVSTGIAWACCASWIANLMMTERTLAKTEEFVEILKEEIKK